MQYYYFFLACYIIISKYHSIYLLFHCNVIVFCSIILLFVCRSPIIGLYDYSNTSATIADRTSGRCLLCPVSLPAGSNSIGNLGLGFHATIARPLESGPWGWCLLCLVFLSTGASTVGILGGKECVTLPCQVSRNPHHQHSPLAPLTRQRPGAAVATSTFCSYRSHRRKNGIVWPLCEPTEN